MRLNRLLLAVLAGLGILLMLLSITNVVEMLHLRGHFPLPQYDFETYYLAAASLNSETQPIVYPLETLRSTSEQLGLDLVWISPYLYPPIWAVFLRPVARFPLESAKTLWLGINLAALFIVTIVLVHTFARSSALRVAIPLGVLLIAFSPVTMTLVLGQVNLILLALIVGALALTQRTQSSTKAEIAAGWLLGLATAIKLFPGILILPFLLQRRYRVVVWTVIAFAAFGLMGIWGAGWGNTYSYLSTVLLGLVGKGKQLWINQSLLGVGERLFHGYSWTFPFRLVPEGSLTVGVVPLADNLPLGRALARLASVVIGLATLAILWGRRREAARPGSHAAWSSIGLLLVLTLIVSPVVWDSNFTLALVVTGILAIQLPYMTPGRQATTLIGLLLTWLFILGIRFWYWIFVITPYPPAWTSAPGLVAAFILWLMLAVPYSKDQQRS
ncbi:glycosyltransferase family 87 protein [Chloroflexota bacterium]